MYDFIAVTTVAFIAYVVLIAVPTGPWSASSLFAYTQYLMAIGSFALMKTWIAADRLYGWVVFASILIYMFAAGAILKRRMKRRSATPGQLRVSTYRLSPAMLTLLVTAAAITVAYYQAIGYSALARGLQSAMSGQGQDAASIAAERIDGYAGSRYLFPGYVNQFKNSILPGLAVVFITQRIRTGRSHWHISMVLVPLSLFALLGTGQRSHFVMFAATCLLYLYLIGGRRVPRAAIPIVAVAAILLLMATIGLGRSSGSLTVDASIGERSAVAASEIQKRVFVDQQESAVYGFRYISTLETQDGRQWLAAAEGILPTSRGSDLANRIYHSMFGTTRGTAPPSLWGSVYLNFGWPGVLVAPVLLAVAFGAISRRGAEKRDRNTLELMGIAGTFVTIGTWASDSPMYLINTGLLVYAWMWWLGGAERVRESRSGTRRSPRTVSGS